MRLTIRSTSPGKYEIEVSDATGRRYLATVTRTDDDGLIVQVYHLHEAPRHMIEAEVLTPVVTPTCPWWAPGDLGPADVADEVVDWLARRRRGASVSDEGPGARLAAGR